MPAPSAPDTVRKGVPFTVTFTTVYNSSICWQPDGDSITPNPVLTELGLTKVRLTTIVPMEAWVLPPGYAGPCELLQEGVRSVQVTLATPGIDTIRLVGRPFPPITANLLDTASFTVFVLP
ncbi:MAG TPA: hypothetical protein VEV39_12830 [Gemmatimonadales bacterium]|nr:hypothetical protein [Gemmatimonadales bacterium]